MLRPCFDTKKHLALHDEVRRLEDQEAERRENYATHTRRARPTRTNQQAGGALVHRLHDEGAPVLEHERPPGLDGRDAPPQVSAEPNSM